MGDTEQGPTAAPTLLGACLGHCTHTPPSPNPTSTGKVTLNWKIIIQQSFSHRSESSEPLINFSSLRVRHQEQEPPEHRVLFCGPGGPPPVQELHRTGGDRDSTLRGCTRDFTCIGTQHKAVAPQKPGLHLPVGAGGSPGVVGVNCGSLWGQEHWEWRPRESWLTNVSSPGGSHFGTKTWPHPTACRVQGWDASSETTSNGGEYSSNHQQTGC